MRRAFLTYTAAVLVLAAAAFSQVQPRDPEWREHMHHVLLTGGVRVGSSMTGPLIDDSGANVRVPGLVVGSATLSGTELAFIDGVTAGTVTASKACVVDANKDIGDFRNLDLVNLDAGVSGTAGSLDVFPATAAKGKLTISAGDSAGDTTTTLVNASQAGARTYTIPDAGQSASFVMTFGDQIINGNKTLTGTTTISGGIARTGQEYQASGPPKVGATAGWVVNAGVNLYEATLPASQTGSTLVVPVAGLKIGWTITAFKCEAQIESAGGTATLDTNLRKLTNAAADPTDASVDTTTQVSVTADTKAEPSKTLGTPDVVAADEWFYILLTGTTAAATDMRYLGCTLTVTEG